jgi:hypothetical protein
MNYLRTSNKLRKQLLNSVSEGIMSMYDDYCPFHKEGPPDTWTDEQKRVWDMLTEAESRITQRIEETLVK